MILIQFSWHPSLADYSTFFVDLYSGRICAWKSEGWVNFMWYLLFSLHEFCLKFYARLSYQYVRTIRFKNIVTTVSVVNLKISNIISLGFFPYKEGPNKHSALRTYVFLNLFFLPVVFSMPHSWSCIIKARYDQIGQPDLGPSDEARLWYILTRILVWFSRMADTVNLFSAFKVDLN